MRDRPPIPEQTKREIRQRCGFGCVICGNPFCQYEHVRGWANVKEHVAADITLLCHQHHGERGGALLRIEDVKRANDDPYNRRTGASPQYHLHYSGDTCEAIVGGNRFSAVSGAHFGTVVGNYLVPVMVDGTPLLMFRLEDGHLLLNLFVLDECNEPLLQIVDNELVYRPDAWDIKLVSNRLTVHEAARRILLEVVFEVPNCIVLRRGRLLCNGVEMLLRPRDVRITNNETRIGASDFPGWTGGLVIGPTQGLSPAIHITGVPRYGNDGSAELEWVESDGDDPAASPASA